MNCLAYAADSESRCACAPVGAALVDALRQGVAGAVAVAAAHATGVREPGEARGGAWAWAWAWGPSAELSPFIFFLSYLTMPKRLTEKRNTITDES